MFRSDDHVKKTDYIRFNLVNQPELPTNGNNQKKQIMTFISKIVVPGLIGTMVIF